MVIPPPLIIEGVAEIMQYEVLPVIARLTCNREIFVAQFFYAAHDFLLMLLGEEQKDETVLSE